MVPLTIMTNTLCHPRSVTKLQYQCHGFDSYQLLPLFKDALNRAVSMRMKDFFLLQGSLFSEAARRHTYKRITLWVLFATLSLLSHSL